MKSHLSESQVKALLIVASKPRRPSTSPYADLLDRAAKETTKVEELAPGWIVHRYEVRGTEDLDDPRLADLICESYRDLGEQGRLRAARGAR